MNRDDILNQIPPMTEEMLMNMIDRIVGIAVMKEREAIIQIITDYKIPVGNSRSGELAAEWTVDALRELRDQIRARGEA